MTPSGPKDLSGQRFSVRYHLTGTETAAQATAASICREQTVEVPDEVIPLGPIREQIVGRLEAFHRVASGAFEATISFATETAGAEFTQLLNVIFGNISLQPGIRVARVDVPASGFSWLKGPRFGRKGIRTRLAVPDRPLLCTAVKPMGLSAKELADLAYQFALGGIDIIKDDHGLADQPFCPFEERVTRCAEAVARANRETGRHCLYAPNVTGPAGVSIQRALFAKQAGAGGLLISPGLTGWDTMRQLAEDERLVLPVIMHPALLGSFATDPHSGLSHYTLFGQLPRLAGADACIFPTYGSRFYFSRDDCRSIAEGANDEFGAYRRTFPTPGGGLTFERLPELIEFYGPDVILLVGGALRQYGPDLVANCQQFHRFVSRTPAVKAG